MQAGQGFRRSFIVTGQTPKTRRPAEDSFDHPSARQQHKASFHRREFEGFGPDSLPFRDNPSNQPEAIHQFHDFTLRAINFDLAILDQPETFTLWVIPEVINIRFSDFYDCCRFRR